VESLELLRDEEAEEAGGKLPTCSGPDVLQLAQEGRRVCSNLYSAPALALARSNSAERPMRGTTRGPGPLAYAYAAAWL